MPTHIHYSNTYIYLGGHDGGDGSSCPQVCGAGVGAGVEAGATVRGPLDQDREGVLSTPPPCDCYLFRK